MKVKVVGFFGFIPESPWHHRGVNIDREDQMKMWQRFQVEVPGDVFDALADLSRKERRPIRQHAGYLIEQAVLREAEKVTDKAIPVPA